MQVHQILVNLGNHGPECFNEWGWQGEYRDAEEKSEKMRSIPNFRITYCAFFAICALVPIPELRPFCNLWHNPELRPFCNLWQLRPFLQFVHCIAPFLQFVTYSRIAPFLQFVYIAPFLQFVTYFAIAPFLQFIHAFCALFDWPLKSKWFTSQLADDWLNR